MRTSIESAPEGEGIFALCIFAQDEVVRLGEGVIGSLAATAQATGRAACGNDCGLEAVVTPTSDETMTQIEIGCDETTSACCAKQLAAVIAAYNIAVNEADARGVQSTSIDGW